MPGLRETLEAATPGRWLVSLEDGDEWWFGGGDDGQAVIRPEDGNEWESVCVMSGDSPNARLIALAPELAALVLDMGELLLRILDRDHHGDFINGENAKPEDVAALLARLDQLGKEQT